MNDSLCTPRMQSACKRVGVSPRELVPRDFDSFFLAGDISEMQKLRFTRYEVQYCLMNHISVEASAEA